ncbi:MAG TPA: twin-arginine translocation signal domain-containing protein [Burkholderiales bacterium]|nr:twin-arginine translocation signal domain-containing protein [Burkholderiales bacterium]
MMQDDNPTPKNRRDFLVMAAAATAGLGATLPLAGTAAAATGPSTEFTRWLDSIPGQHKQVTDWPDLNHGMGLIYTFSFLLTAPGAYGVPESDTGAVLVIRHNTIPIVLGHEMWSKYSLGEVFKIDDPETGAAATRNPFYEKPGGLPFEAAALQKLIERGVKVAACELALTFYSGKVASKMGLQHEDVKNEWLDAVHPGIQVVPSGTVACSGAVARGCGYLFGG